MVARIDSPKSATFGIMQFSLLRLETRYRKFKADPSSCHDYRRKMRSNTMVTPRKNEKETALGEHIL